MARGTDVGTTPVPVGAAAEAFVVVRLRPGGGLPMVLRDEPHVRSDRLGVALRRALADFAAARQGSRAA